MRKIMDFIEGPILYAMSRGMSFVYREWNVSPRRQVPAWEMAVAAVEAMVLAALAIGFFRVGEPNLTMVFIFISLSPITGFLTSWYEVRRLSNQYDAAAYRAALTLAERNRLSATGVLLRASALILPVSALLLLSLVLSDRIWIAWVVTAYYALYASKFFVRACEPPHPDEGDFSAVPQPG